jgi:hypothetical protein
MYYYEYENGEYNYILIQMTGKLVAIKKVTRTLKSPINAKQIYRELKLLMYLNHPDAQVCIK